MLKKIILSAFYTSVLLSSLNADESLLGFTKSAEPMPAGAMDLVQHTEVHGDKGGSAINRMSARTDEGRS